MAAPGTRKPATSYLLKMRAANGYDEISIDVNGNLEALKETAASVGKMIGMQWEELKAKLPPAKMCAELAQETKLAFTTKKFAFAKELLSPFPLTIFAWTFLVGMLWCFSVLLIVAPPPSPPSPPMAPPIPPLPPPPSPDPPLPPLPPPPALPPSLPPTILDPEEAMQTLKMLVSLVFFAAGGVGAVLFIIGGYTRGTYKYFPAKLDAMFDSGSGTCSRFCKHEMYLSLPHMIAIGGMLLSITFFCCVGLAYLVPQLVAPAIIQEPLSDSAKWLLLPASLLVVAMIMVRRAATIDICYLYTSILEKTAFADEWKRGTSRGALFCVLGFGLGMLCLDGGLYKAGWEFEGGIGMSKEVEASLLPTIDLFFSLVKWFFVPICFVGLSAIVATIRRGLYVYPGWGKYPTNKDGSVKPSYEMDAAAAFAEGTFAEFRKIRYKRWFLTFFCSTAVLLGVAVLIPFWTFFYFAVTQPVKAACEAYAEGAAAVALPLPVGEMTSAIADGILYGIPVVCDFVPWLCGAIGTVPSTYWSSIEELSQYPVDLDKACEVAIGVDYWMKVMLFGLILHLPAAMSAWHLLSRYTMLMQVQDTLAERA